MIEGNVINSKRAKLYLHALLGPQHPSTTSRYCSIVFKTPMFTFLQIQWTPQTGDRMANANQSSHSSKRTAPRRRQALRRRRRSACRRRGAVRLELWLLWFALAIRSPVCGVHWICRNVNMGVLKTMLQYLDVVDGC